MERYALNRSNVLVALPEFVRAFLGVLKSGFYNCFLVTVGGLELVRIIYKYIIIFWLFFCELGTIIIYVYG